MGSEKIFMFGEPSTGGRAEARRSRITLTNMVLTSPRSYAS